MSGLDETQVKSLKHINSTLFDDEKMRYCLSVLWYSTSEQSYIQRTTSFDDSIFCHGSEKYKSVVDKYLMAYLAKKLKLDVIKQLTEKLSDFESERSNLKATQRNVILLYNHKRENSFLYALDSKLRNSIAHGVMNFESDGSAVFVGQVNGKQSAEVNLFISLYNVELLQSWYQNREKLLNYDLESFQEEIYSMYFGEMTKNQKGYYTLFDETIVFFDNDFHFKEKKDKNQESQIKSQIKRVFEEHSILKEKKVVYLISDVSNSLFNGVTSDFPNTSVIPENRLLQYFGIA